MKVTDFYNEVARNADTDKTNINVADVKRVLSEAFIILSKMDSMELMDTLSKGIAIAAKKASK